jgi:hypothetical protein
VGLNSPIFLQGAVSPRARTVIHHLNQNEKWTAPADRHSGVGQYDPAAHGQHGINSVALNGYAWPNSDTRIIQTTKDLPDEWPFVLDMNAGENLGVGMYYLTLHLKRIGWKINRMAAVDYQGRGTKQLCYIIPRTAVYLETQPARLTPCPSFPRPSKQ